MSRRALVSVGIAVALFLGSTSLAQWDAPERLLRLVQTGATTGPFAWTTQSGDVEIETGADRTRLEFNLFGLKPNAVYSVWLEFDTSRAPFSGTGGNFVATDPQTGTAADVYGYTPATADDARFTGGVGLDPNGFVTDESGNALFMLELNYDIFHAQAAPIVLRPGATQMVRAASSSGSCVGARDGTLASRIDSAYMRIFDISMTPRLPARSPAFPRLSEPMKARLFRGPVREIRIVEHFDGITHGHLRGVGTGQGGLCMDHDFRLQGFLTNAAPKRF